MKFKPGDKVKCINNENQEDNIFVNNIYTIDYFDNVKEQYKLEENEYFWFEWRFVRANSHIIKEKLGVK